MPGTAQPRAGGTEPATAVTEFVCTLVADVLGRGSVEPDDDFFADLSGDSLGAAAVIVTLEEIFGVPVLEAFFADPTPSGMAREVEGHLHREGFDAGRAREAVPAGGAVADSLSRLLNSLGDRDPAADPGRGGSNPGSAA